MGCGGDAKLFDEHLPAQCPPAAAGEQGYDLAFRLLSSEPPSKAHFASQAAEGRLCPNGVDPCRWASCSFFTDKPLSLLKLPHIRKRFGFLATLKIPPARGRSVLTGSHIDYWRYAGVDPTEFVLEVEAV